MLSGASDGDGVQDLEKVKVEHFQKVIRCSVRGSPLAPSIERPLSVAEYLVD